MADPFLTLTKIGEADGFDIYQPDRPLIITTRLGPDGALPDLAVVDTLQGPRVGVRVGKDVRA